MASTVAGRRLTEQHRVAQLRLQALTTAEMRSLWSLLDVDRLSDTAPTWLSAAGRLVAQQHGFSVELARRYFRAFRLVETGQPFTVAVPSPAVDPEAVRTSLTVTGPVRIERARRRALPIGRATELALTESSRAASRHVANGGRRFVASAASSDRRARGWARVTSGNSCDFCSMLAGRGAAYGRDTVDFEAHDGCACSAEPAY